MNALSGPAYAGYARTRIAEARQAIVAHAVCAYTGLCLGCGRPGPCASLLDARRTLAHHCRRVTNQRAEYTWSGHRPEGVPVKESSSSDNLRAACLAVESALDRAVAHLGRVDHPLPRTALARWDGALTNAWQALSLVYSGTSEARKLLGAAPASVGDLLDGLRAARVDADRAGTVAVRVRRQLAAAEDRLRRTGLDEAARIAADRWGAAGARLDLAVARLAIGARAIDRYADALAGTTAPEPTGAAQPARAAPLRPAAPDHVGSGQVAMGARTAGAVLLVVNPWGGWRGYLARARRERQLDRERNRQW